VLTDFVLWKESASVDANLGLDAGWSRRRALQSAGAALASAVAIGEHAPGAVAQAPAATPTIPPDFKVVLHAAEVQNWPYVLSNLRNLTQEWPRAQLRVVVDGSAVTSLQGTNNLTAELTQLAGAGVQLHVCPNALHEHGIDPGTIPTVAQTNLGGVVALVLAQHEGYAYVKP
jgi:intracellular sulfur oxidation DsrE/DsrF family protein